MKLKEEKESEDSALATMSRSMDESESTADQENENEIKSKSKSRRRRSNTNHNLSNTEAELEQAEEHILAYLTTPYKGRYVNIGKTVGKEESKIWTISFNEHLENTPLVLIHGMGAGIGFWVINLDELTQDRPLYAIDLLGFGRSSRPNFSSDPAEIEAEMAASIEAWRIAMKLEKIIVVGHSLGGYLSTAYAIRYPEPVAHLILADPWGFKEKRPEEVVMGKRQIPFYARVLIRIFEPLNPLWSIRLAGKTMGPKLIQRYRPDIISKYANFIVEDPHIKVSNYMYYCNALNPTGETAFHTLMVKFGWAKNPMSHRLDQLDKDIPMTLLYGSNSWVDHFPIDELKKLREDSYCEGYILEGAGHHIYADQKDDFNQHVRSACLYTDQRVRSVNTEKDL